MELVTVLVFLHLAGIIIGLGAVTVIDTMGFIARKSVKWTKTTIHAHHVTKPLIWIGTVLATLAWIPLYRANPGDPVFLAKTLILPVLYVNGAFLSFYISPRLDQRAGVDETLPAALQWKITVAFLISFTGWWTFVFLTAYHLT